ncbi:hypothetical protein F5X68DRAFT_273410 [Plectosphaerella plurivora]|uniref:LITAF domain-containing protein n=1 Tax=Plectosphaerella plurivora TaxID=936078 RepID=A0A9P8VLD1_9PEZI|nr:hypothetical protein F5X68DRAFT_273410 [Plectosphaerella plurivora]
MSPSPTNSQAVTPGPDYSASARCPACAYRGNTIIVSTSPSNQSVGLMLLYLLFCLSCACCLLGDTRDSSLVYYCERCGLRLVTEDNKGSQVQYDSSTLMPVPEETKTTKSQLPPGSKVARSPLGLPPPLNRPEVVNLKDRYRHLTPIRKLIVETGRFGLPTKVTDPSNTADSSYLIESPGIPPESPETKKERQFLQRCCSWSQNYGVSRQTPSFRVNSTSQDGVSRELAWVVLFGGSNWNADLHVSSGEPTNGNETFVEHRMYAAEESDWNASGAGVLWKSSEGLLLWSMRTVRDAEGINARGYCLLDAYDRLVVALRKIRRPEDKGKVWELRVYADVSEQFLAEILASYTAMRCQQERIVQEHIYDSS